MHVDESSFEDTRSRSDIYVFTQTRDDVRGYISRGSLSSWCYRCLLIINFDSLLSTTGFKHTCVSLDYLACCTQPNWFLLGGSRSISWRVGHDSNFLHFELLSGWLSHDFWLKVFFTVLKLCKIQLTVIVPNSFEKKVQQFFKSTLIRYTQTC